MYTPEFFADPHPTYARMREEAAVHHVTEPNGLKHFFVLRYAEARAALADPRLAKDPRHAWEALRAAGMVSGEPQDATFDLHTTDPPEHTRLRSLVAKAFTSGRVAALRPRVQEIADELLDATGEEFDVIADYAYPLSLTVIAELLGVPIDDQDSFRAWTIAALTPATRAEGGRQLRAHMTELVAAHRPGDDLLSELIAAGLSTEQVVALAQQLLFAGHEPTTNLIGNAVVALLRNPGAGAPNLDELMRYDGPTARASPRYATEDLQIGGVEVPKGGVVIVGIAAANRDPRRFTAPDALDLSRVDNPHLAFGHGVHRCVGAALARLEGEVAITTLLDRYPDLRLVAEPEWLPFPVFRGVSSLRVRRPA
ncbi:cytochrome P450 family protein [Lentzea terrae]|uniref:cytochrome P450 family protein n=1 Tax=Lentzea terrae TaxID=2200761 RepID=UPI000DD3E694|nr:cytochrome P450 [Lentzea terrae]